MRNAYAAQILRSVTGSWGRFLAILGIVALGCGFFAGLNMTGADMRRAADTFYDASHLYDIRVVSTMGFTDEQVQKIRSTEGIAHLMPSRSVDVMASVNSDQYAMRISSLPEAAADGDTDDPSYLDRISLVSGRWPEAADECVMGYDPVMREPLLLGDTVKALYGTASLDGVLAQRTFKVVGFVRMPDFLNISMLGTTSLGSGKIEQFLFVPRDAFAADMPYTQVYATVEGASALDSFSPAYESLVGEVEDRLKKESDALAQSRFEQVKADAERRAEDGARTLAERRQEADEKLGAAEAQLADAAAQLASHQAEIDEGGLEAASGWDAYWAGKAEAERRLADGKARLEASAASLDAADAQLGMSQSDIDKAREKLAAGERELAAGKETWAETRGHLVAAEGDLATISGTLSVYQAWLGSGKNPDEAEKQELIAKTKEAIAAARDLMSQEIPGQSSEEMKGAAEKLAKQVMQEFEGIDFSAPEDEVIAAIRRAMPAALAHVTDAVGEAKTKISDGIAQGDDRIAAAEKELSDNAAKLAQAQDARRRIDEGRAELERGWDTWWKQKAATEAQLAAAYQRLLDAERRLDEGQNELDAGRARYEEGEAEFRLQKASAESQLADGARQLQEARKKIGELKPPSIYVLDRGQGIGQASYRNDAARIDSIAAVFPLFFFLVAALVALTSMTRMVEDDRGEIGLYKALGYSTGQIAAKYLIYAAAASTAGCILGIALLGELLPWIIMSAYRTIYVMPLLPLPLPISPFWAALSAVSGIGITLGATFCAVWAEMKEMPAALMLPKAPKAGKRILLERLPFVWSRMGFLWKVTFRNLFRYKKRLVMTVVGIAGCTALLLTGLGIRDAIQDIIGKQFGEIVHYNVDIRLTHDATEKDRDEIVDYLASEGGCSDFAWGSDANMKAGTASAKPLSIRLIVPQDPASFERLVTLKERTTGRRVPFDAHSVLLSEKLARQLGVRIGDTIDVYGQDEIGNACGTPHRLEVTGIVENYVSYFVYVGADAYRAAFGSTAGIDHLYAKVADGSELHRKMLDALHGEPGVDTVVFNDETISTYTSMLKTVDQVMVILVVAAALLAFIVLYNLTNINIAERVREIASLKVLGFTQAEVRAYVFRETLLLSVIGAFVGLFAGTAMEQFVIVTAEVDYVMFGRQIDLLSFAAAFAITIAFTLIVMAALAPKLARIDMVESLKSVD